MDVCSLTALDVCPVCEEGPDSPRYRGLGNAVTVNTVEWILRRIARLTTAEEEQK